MIIQGVQESSLRRDRHHGDSRTDPVRRAPPDSGGERDFPL